jgi:hypothetical protein
LLLFIASENMTLFFKMVIHFAVITTHGFPAPGGFGELPQTMITPEWSGTQRSIFRVSLKRQRMRREVAQQNVI